MEFEWDPEKAKSNFEKHGIDFRDAARLFTDPCRLEEFDAASSNDEDRYIVIGAVEGRILYLVYTYREDRIRLISARKATPSERKTYASFQT